MKQNFFTPNVKGWGRWLRGIGGLLCAGGGLYLALAMDRDWGWLFVAAGIFMVYEAARGWCLMRACGFKTPF